MKNLIIGLITAVLLSGGLVGLTSEAANATCDEYAGCPNTNAKLKAPNRVPKGQRTKLCVVVRTPGSGNPQGTVEFNVRGPRGFSFSDTKRYGRSGATCTGTPKLKRTGKYKATVKFIGDDFRNSRGATTFKVVRRGR